MTYITLGGSGYRGGGAGRRVRRSGLHYSRVASLPRCHPSYSGGAPGSHPVARQQEPGDHNFLISVTFPSLRDTLGLAYGFYAVCAVLSFLFVWRWVEETKGKTLEDMHADAWHHEHASHGNPSDR